MYFSGNFCSKRLDGYSPQCDTTYGVIKLLINESFDRNKNNNYDNYNNNYTNNSIKILLSVVGIK